MLEPGFSLSCCKLADMIPTCTIVAERRLLDAWSRQARKHGLKSHQIATWIRRKAGPEMTVWRHRMDGTLGCATPCLLCQRELVRLDIKVNCSQPDSTWFSGRLDEPGAPCSKMTNGQLKLLLGQSPYPDRPPKQDPQSHHTRHARYKRASRRTLPPDHHGPMP